MKNGITRAVNGLELLNALRRVIDRLPKDVFHQVELDKVTVRDEDK